MPRKPQSNLISDQLRLAIEESGESRYAIAKATGITEATLSRFVNGVHGLSLEKVDVICEHLVLRLTKGTEKASKKRRANR
jgi:transcriptional regulator with XRE-family HTH domain